MLRWQVLKVGLRTIVALNGVLDENADLRPLTELSGEVSFDLSGVRRISSTGVREWIELMRHLDRRCRVSLVACSPASVTQLNLISNFRGRAQVESFMAPYECPTCGAEREVLVDSVTVLRTGGLSVPPQSCGDCATPMELSELPERYLVFLMDQRGGRPVARA
ncbi:MAG: hypothetical protein H6709_14810 [Kofleriaceae bacterium]|nr:hypothetical protein [Myxococcales bacterium]MCB9565212.1 hypothetical protein [Kofleriaceae bacterium]MCB9573349.1 hypothetical protein [Kofleriaceae bacterium]